MIIPSNKVYGKHVEKKLLPEYYDAVCKNIKTFELRKDEDDIQAGDVLILHEWDGEKYTGHKLTREVTYVLRDCPQYGLMDGYCIIGIMPIGWDMPYVVLSPAYADNPTGLIFRSTKCSSFEYNRDCAQPGTPGDTRCIMRAAGELPRPQVELPGESQGAGF